MVDAKVKTTRLAQITPVHVAAYSVLSAGPKSIASVAASYGASAGDAEKHLSLLVDQALAVRTVGDRTTAKYTLA